MTATDAAAGPALLAAVEQVDALDVAPTHLRGRAEGGVAVGEAHHGGEEVVFGEGQPASKGVHPQTLENKTPEPLCAAESWSSAPLLTDLL